MQFSRGVASDKCAAASRAMFTSVLLLLLLLHDRACRCELRCDTSQWNLETLECSASGERANSILSRGRTSETVFTTTSATFERFDWTRIRTFRMRDCRLLSISPDLFKSAGNLANLDLSGNPDLCFNGDEFTNLRGLLTLRLAGTGRCPGAGLLGDLPGLLSLDLSGLRVRPAFFSLPGLAAFPRLRVADLSRNSDVDFRTFTVGGSLRTLSASYTEVKLGNNCFQNATQLNKIYLSHCRIGDLPRDTFKGAAVEQLDLSYNHIGVAGLSSLTASMRSVNLSHNLIGDLIRPGLLKQGLEVLDLSYNNISFLHVESFWLTDKLVFISLAHNQLSWMYDKEFAEMPSVKELDLSYNQMTSFFDTFFSDLVNLETLNLAGNLMRKLDNNLFQYNSNLKHLFLQSNRLHALNILTFEPLRRLHTLDLRSNRLKRLPEGLLHSGSLASLAVSCNRLSYLAPAFFKGKRGARVALQGNPWKCGCLSPLVDALNVYELRIDSQHFNEGTHPTCYVGETYTDSCDDNTLSEQDYVRWERAMEATGIRC